MRRVGAKLNRLTLVEIARAAGRLGRLTFTISGFVHDIRASLTRLVGFEHDSARCARGCSSKLSRSDKI
jgi:hypothetical protein